MTTTTKNQKKRSNSSINGQYRKDEQQQNNGNNENNFNHLQLKLPNTNSKPTIPSRYPDSQSIDYNSDSDVAAFMRRRKFAIDHHHNKDDYLQHLTTPSQNQDEINQLQQNKSSSLKIKEQTTSHAIRSPDEKANHNSLAITKRPSYEEYLNRQGDLKKVNNISIIRLCSFKLRFSYLIINKCILHKI